MERRGRLRRGGQNHFGAVFLNSGNSDLGGGIKQSQTLGKQIENLGPALIFGQVTRIKG